MFDRMRDDLSSIDCGRPTVLVLVRQIVHAGGDDTHRARHQLSRAGALEAVVGHVTHAAMEPGGQPGTQTRLCGDKSTPATPIWENPNSRPHV